MNALAHSSSSSPRIGPAGTAICAYRADNSLTRTGSGGHNLGIFDIFREDIRVNAVVGGASAHEEENRFTEVRSCCMKWEEGSSSLTGTSLFLEVL